MLRSVARDAQKIGLLVSELYYKENGARLAAARTTLAKDHQCELDFIVLPQQPNTVQYLSYDSRNVLPDADLQRVTCGFASNDMEVRRTRPRWSPPL